MTAAPFQIFPDLEPAVEAALRESIRHFGVVYPAVVDQHGQVIDGHHRLRIAAEENVDCPTTVHEVADDDEAAELAFTLNADRRQIPAEHRKAIVATLRKQGHSLRAIAGAVGADPATVHRDLAGVADATGAPDDAGDPSPQNVVGLDGKTYPSRRAARDAEQDVIDDALRRAGIDDREVTAEERAWYRERDEALGALIGLARSINTISAKYTPDEYVARFGEVAIWPKVRDDLASAVAWVNELTEVDR